MEEIFKGLITKHNDEGWGAVIRDGIPFPEIYRNQDLKVLFILKEPHDEEGKNLDQIKFYKEYALRESNDDCKGLITKIGMVYQEIFDYDGDARDAIKRIAFMNLKKSGGGATCNNTTLKEYARKCKKLIINQINEINPDYIVCFGSFDFLVRDVILDDEEEVGKLDERAKRWRKSNISIAEGKYRYRLKSQHQSDVINYKVIFSMNHPSMRGISRKDYIKNCKDNFQVVLEDIESEGIYGK